MNLKSLIFVTLLFVTGVLQAQSKLTIDLNKTGINVSPTHYGIFFEDINHAADGGLYAELIKNRSFEDATTIDPWVATTTNGAAVTLSLDKTNPLNTFQTNSLKMVVTSASTTARAGVYNPGFWGINVVAGQQYKLTFFAKRDVNFSGDITASLENSDGAKYATAVISGLTDQWQKFTCTLTPAGSFATGRLVLSANSTGTIWFDVVSLFPPTFNNRPNGLRPDLAQMVADMHPKFMRFPGGCFVEGDFIANRFQWKQTIGNIENRPGHYNLWGYRTSDGMGYHEFLQLSEDIGAEPLYVFNIGVAHGNVVIYNQVDAYIQDALDAIEYANGDLTTTYGAMRAANGHPEPFNLKYVEIGNENSGNDRYAERYFQFHNAIKAKYPYVTCIADGDDTGTDDPTMKVSNLTDMMDEHYYSSPQWFISQAFKYDTYSRTGPKVYVGEYAVTNGCGQGNLSAAIGEAAFMTGMEKNSDKVIMNSYAPMFVNVNDRKWNPDMIVYNSSTAYGTPSYYVQKLFATNLGNVIIPIKDSLISKDNIITGAVGLGSWSTAVNYSNVSVTKSDGTVIFADQFANSSNWTPAIGTWSVAGGIYSQTGTLTDCRTIGANITDSVYTYSVKARKTSGNEGFLILFGNKDSNNFYWWNIGGWGNTQHAIEQCINGAKSVLTTVPGSVTLNKWYDISIEVKKDRVLFYLDNVLIHNMLSSSPYLFTSASLDTSVNQLFVKVVNTATTTQNTTIDLRGLSTDNVSGTATELTSANLADENSLLSPTKIVPVTTTINSSTPAFNYDFKPNSVTVLKLNVTKALGIVETKSSINDVKIFPTFTHNYVFIQKTIGEKYSISLLDSMGKLIFELQSLGAEKIDLTDQQSGVYFIRIKTDNKVFIQKVIKN